MKTEDQSNRPTLIAHLLQMLFSSIRFSPDFSFSSLKIFGNSRKWGGAYVCGRGTGEERDDLQATMPDTVAVVDAVCRQRRETKGGRIDISVEFTSNHNAEVWILTNIYGPCTPAEKLQFTTWLKNIQMSKTIP